MTTVNYLGIAKTVRVTRIILTIVVGTLALITTLALMGRGTSIQNFSQGTELGVFGVFQAAGFLFFAFAGYARIATLGEEVRDPETSIPRAIPIALGIVVAIYAIVMGAALLSIGPSDLATSAAPLAEVVLQSPLPNLAPIARIGASSGGSR